MLAMGLRQNLSKHQLKRKSEEKRAEPGKKFWVSKNRAPVEVYFEKHKIKHDCMAVYIFYKCI
jgi:hypothetical protein